MDKLTGRRRGKVRGREQSVGVTGTMGEKNDGTGEGNGAKINFWRKNKR